MTSIEKVVPTVPPPPDGLTPEQINQLLNCIRNGAALLLANAANIAQNSVSSRRLGIVRNDIEIIEIINSQKQLAENLAYEIHSQDDAADAGIKDIYMALKHYEEHLHTQKTDSQS